MMKELLNMQGDDEDDECMHTIKEEENSIHDNNIDLSKVDD